jgi:SAM-dependent methyltransferase
MEKITNDKYYKYLQSRSIFGALYRKYFLYPKLNKRLNGKILDLGCGIGDFLKFNKNSIGLDVNPLIVEYCQSQDLRVGIMEIDIIPFDDCSIDSIIMDNVIEHIDNPHNILKEVGRVLNVGGNFLIGVPGRKGYSHDPDHKIFYSEKNLIDLIEKFDFHVKDIFYTPLKSEFLNIRLRQYCLYIQFVKNE